MTTHRKSVLGRGLDALIPQATSTPIKEISIRRGAIGEDTGKDDIIASISLKQIQPNPFQPRAEFDEKALEELTQSILEKGVIQPITVRRKGNSYEIISGERRLRAAQRARLDRIPAYIRRVDSDEDMLEMALIENIQREQLNPIEVALAFQSLIERCNLRQEEVAQKVGKERSTVTNFIRLLKLPQRIQIAIRRGELSMGHARALLGLRTESDQNTLFNRIIKSDLSVRKVEHLVSVMTGEQSNKKKTKSKTVLSLTSLDSVEEKLRRKFGTKVAVRVKSDGKGEILIEYYSADDLERIVEILTH
jgi:ParB family chromosome partitioning protein